MGKVTMSDGAVINYYVDDYTPPWEKAETIVMCHASSYTAMQGLFIAGHLATKYRVIRLDERGLGGSTMAPGTDPLEYKPDLEFLAKDVLQVIDALGLKQIHFFGFMSGGWIGQQFCVSYPERVKSLLLCTSPSASPLDALYDENTYNDIMRLGIRGWMEQGRGRELSVKRDSHVTPEMIEYEMTERAKNKKEVVAARWKFSRYVPGKRGGEVFELMPKLKLPVFMITGSDCNLVPPKTYIEMKEVIPQAQICILPNEGCSITYTAPERVAKETISFLNKLKR
jgi:3-oxoadipate enol-lactonase